MVHVEGAARLPPLRLVLWRGVSGTVLDFVNFAEACSQQWYSYACETAMQKAGVDAATMVLGILCPGSKYLNAACNAVLTAGGQYLLNKFGFVAPDITESSPSSESSVGTGGYGAGGTGCQWTAPATNIQSPEANTQLQGSSVQLQGSSVQLQ